MRTDTQGRDPSKRWLDGAYELSTPADNRAYYKGFARAYDQEFAGVLGYSYPGSIAEAYLGNADPKHTPIADIGCGTGLVAEALPRDVTIDGFDISPDMLAVAHKKSLYGALYEADITADMSRFGANYGAVVSAGTFTHGHLGPAPLANLLQLARGSCLFVIGVNQAHFERQDFAAVLDRMVADRRISQPSLCEVPIYETRDHDHAADKALVVVFYKREKGR